MLKLSEKLNIAWEDTVDVNAITVDRMQGHESDMIILDWVVDPETKFDLVFASDNHRANIAITRANTCLIVVTNGCIFNNDRLGVAKRSLRRYTWRLLSISSISWIITLLLIIQIAIRATFQRHQLKKDEGDQLDTTAGRMICVQSSPRYCCH